MNDQHELNQEIVKLAKETTELNKEMAADIKELKYDRSASALLLKLLISAADVTSPTPVSTIIRQHLREQLDGSQPHARIVLEKSLALLPLADPRPSA